MKAGTFFIRIWRISSIPGFLISLFSSYISYPEEVAVRFDEFNRSIQTVNREVIFYAAVAIFILSFTLLRTASRLFLRISTANLPVPNQDSWARHRSTLNEVFTNWFSGLSSAINTITALGLFVLSSLNRGDRSMQPGDYAWFLPLMTVILIAVIAALPIRLFMKPGDDD